MASSQGFAGATSNAFDVKPGATASYTLAIASSVAVGQEVTLSATDYDAYANLATDYGGTAKVTSTDTLATYADNAQFVEGVVQGFKVTFKSPGLQTLTVTDSVKASLSGTAQLNVIPVAQLTVSVIQPTDGAIVSGSVPVSATGAVAQGTTLVKLAILVDGKEIVSGSGRRWPEPGTAPRLRPART